LIEDAAELIGQTYKGKQCGSFGDISTFSFYPNKHITTGEGGMIVCNDEALAERCKKLRNLAFEPKGRRFIHHELGWNYRITNMQAALGLAQLEKIEDHLTQKRKIGEAYQQGLKDVKGFQLPLVSTGYSENIYWVFAIVAESEELSRETVTKLSKHEISTRPFFWCMHEQPVFQKMGLFVSERYQVAERLARNGFYIPSGLGLTETQIKQVINIFTE
ncbi:MAG: DegT/DnrJ/EryC1/StrS family aminotransferase, partial [Ginsengibacter sp.]